MVIGSTVWKSGSFVQATKTEIRDNNVAVHLTKKTQALCYGLVERFLRF